MPYVRYKTKMIVFFCDSAESTVIYFLANASTFKGEDARRLKSELKAAIK